MSDGPSAVSLRSASYRAIAYKFRARACRVKHATIREELSARAADYERLAELEARPFAAPLARLRVKREPPTERRLPDAAVSAIMA